MNRRRIMLIIPELMIGGAQRSLAKLSVALADQHDVWVVVFNTGDGVGFPHGGELISLNVAGSNSFFGKAAAFLTRIRQLGKWKEKLRIEVSISFLEGADYVNILSRKKDKTILGIRGSKLHDETMASRFSWLRKKILIPWLYRKADTIVTVNRGVVKELTSYFGLRGSRIVTIGNFYDVEEIARLSAEPRNGSVDKLYGDPVLIATGRLAPEKGMKELIRVFHGLKKINDRLRFVIVGDGPLTGEILSICAELKLKAHQGVDFTEVPDVVMLGAVNNVFKYLRGASLFLMNSSSEGFPNGLAEAMICRVPVLSSDCPYGPREILAPDFEYISPVTQVHHSPSGILMPMIRNSSDTTLWIKTIAGLLSDRQALDRMAENGFNRISNFTRNAAMDSWNSAIES